MTEVRYCLAPERCRTSTAGLSPNFGCALSVECGLETPMIPGKGDGQDEDSWEDGRGRAVDELRTVLSCHEDIGMASELNAHFQLGLGPWLCPLPLSIHFWLESWEVRDLRI
jgi:hypothetical protein